MKARDIEKRLRAKGAIAVRQVGSHRRWAYTDGDGVTYRTTVAVHGGDVPVGTLASIEKAMETPFEKVGCDERSRTRDRGHPGR